MRTISASDAKQAFGKVLADALHQPVAIERHGKVVAAVVPASWLALADQLDERRRARETQKQVDLRRLMQHQALAIELLSAQRSDRKTRIEAARREVKRWGDAALCSPDYIDRWTSWLKLTMPELARVMCSDAEGWGTAMRQNSPFGVSFE
jgi:PHD/YefM family antitoxin component YafN of YafNO toxin-antitoxin module